MSSQAANLWQQGEKREEDSWELIAAVTLLAIAGACLALRGAHSTTLVPTLPRDAYLVFVRPMMGAGVHYI